MSTQLRNKLIFLVCILAFIGGGLFLYREWAVRKPFAVILFVSENLSPSQLSAARIFHGGSGFRFAMESLPRTALATARAADFAVADTAAAASALATGQTVNRGSLALSAEGRTLETLLETARARGRATGLVSDTPLTDPATAAFFARATTPVDASALALQLVESAPADVLLGGGRAQLVPEAQGGARADGRDLLLDLRQRGFDIVRTGEELDNTPGWRSPKVFGVFAEGDLAFAEDRERYASQPRLSDLVRRGIELLQFNRRGYLLVVHAGLAGRAGQLGRGETVLRELRELDEAVATAQRFAGEDALLVVAGLGSPGGLRLNSFSFAADRGIAVLGPSSAGVPALTWSTGPGTPAAPEGSISAEPVAARTDQPQPVAEDNLVLGTGPASEQVNGFLDLTDLQRIVVPNL
jgi:alkaline phosphatase